MIFYEQSLTINYLSKTTLTRVIVNELFPFYICQIPNFQSELQFIIFLPLPQHPR